MEKILINENGHRQAEIISEINETIQILNTEFKMRLKEIGIKKITIPVLRDCFDGEASQTRKNYFNAVEKDLETFSVIQIKESLFRDAEIAFEAFETKLRDIKKKIKYADFISIENDLCILTPENKTRLMDSVKIYLTDPKEIEAYKRHKAAADALNVLFKGDFPLYWNSIFVCENGEVKVNEDTNYSKLV